MDNIMPEVSVRNNITGQRQRVSRSRAQQYMAMSDNFQIVGR